MIRPALFLNVFNRPHQLPPDIFAYEDQNATERTSYQMVKTESVWLLWLMILTRASFFS